MRRVTGQSGVAIFATARFGSPSSLDAPSGFEAPWPIPEPCFQPHTLLSASNLLLTPFLFPRQFAMVSAGVRVDRRLVWIAERRARRTCSSSVYSAPGGVSCVFMLRMGPQEIPVPRSRRHAPFLRSVALKGRAWLEIPAFATPPTLRASAKPADQPMPILNVLTVKDRRGPPS